MQVFSATVMPTTIRGFRQIVTSARRTSVIEGLPRLVADERVDPTPVAKELR